MLVRFDCATLSESSDQLNHQGQSAGTDEELQSRIPFNTRSWRSVTYLLPVLVLLELGITFFLLISYEPDPCSP